MKKLIFFVTYVSVKVLVYEAQASNVIGLKQCSLDNIERSDITGDKNASAKMRDRFLSEHEAGGSDYLKIDGTRIKYMKDEYIESICRCFAQVYYTRQTKSQEKYPIVNDKTPVTVSKNYWYCKSQHWAKLMGYSCVGLPVIKCSIEEKFFYLVESGKSYFARGLRNIFLFEMNDADIPESRKVEDGRGVAFESPDGDFKLFASAVNLKQFL